MSDEPYNSAANIDEAERRCAEAAEHRVERSWVVKVRGVTGGTVLHDYCCPEHGVLEAAVPRDAVPDEVPCWVELDGSDERPPRYCGLTSPWSPSVVSCRVRAVETTRGKSEAPPTPMALTTRDLAEGMPINEWKAKRAKLHKERRRAQIKAAMR